MFNAPSFFGFRSGSYGIPFVGLLDTYGGAAAAYSLRGLSTSYVTGGTPYACQVRNSSNVSANIGFVYNPLTGDYDLDTAALLAHCGGGDGFVDVWYDQSGNGYDAIQSIALNQPQIVSSGSVILENGKPSVQFDGSNDEIVITSLSSISLESIFIVNTPSTNVAGLLGASSSTPYLAISSTDARYRTTILNTLQPLTSNANLSLNSFNRSSNIISAYRNSVVSVIPLTGAALINIDRIGRRGTSALFSGKVSEFICYNFDQNSNRANIESNIINFYAL